MKNKNIPLIVFLVFFCFHLISLGVFAASTEDAAEPIIIENECSLTISYRYGETSFKDVEVKLYRIAEVSEELLYTLTEPFEPTGLIINGINSTSEWNVVRSTLEAHIVADNVEPSAVLSTDENGLVCFEHLKTGMYLATVGQVTQDELVCRFETVLVSLPDLDRNGSWNYQVSVNAKAEAMPPVEPDEVIELKVLKLWRGDDGRNDRPKTIEVEIFRDGLSVETVFLSEDVNWSYSWTAKDDGAVWSVVERNVPEGYAMTVESRQNSFVLTNTRITPTPDDPTKPPQMGETVNVMLYVLLMVVSGALLIALGVTRKRTSL